MNWKQVAALLAMIGGVVGLVFLLGWFLAVLLGVIIGSIMVSRDIQAAGRAARQKNR